MDSMLLQCRGIGIGAAVGHGLEQHCCHLLLQMASCEGLLCQSSMLTVGREWPGLVAGLPVIRAYFG